MDFSSSARNPSRFGSVFRIFCCQVLILLLAANSRGDDFIGNEISVTGTANTSTTTQELQALRSENVTADLLRNVSATGLESLNAVMLLAREFSTRNLSKLII